MKIEIAKDHHSIGFGMVYVLDENELHIFILGLILTIYNPTTGRGEENGK